MICDTQQKILIFDNGTNSTSYRINLQAAAISSEGERQYIEERGASFFVLNKETQVFGFSTLKNQVLMHKATHSGCFVELVSVLHYVFKQENKGTEFSRGCKIHFT